MIGQPAEPLLGGTNGFNPFRVTAPVRRWRIWLRRADGSAVLFAFSAAPVFDAEATTAGVRGIGVDWTACDRHAGRVAAALRRGEIVDHVLCSMTQEVVAPRKMQAALDALVNALGAEGAAVIDLPAGAGPVCIARVAVPGRLQAAPLLTTADAPTGMIAADGGPIVVGPCQTRFGAHSGLAMWRSPGSRPWDREDRLRMRSAASLVRRVLE